MGGFGGSQRKQLVERVMDPALGRVSINEGQTGTVLALEAGGTKIAVFKPSAGEQFERRGLEAGSGSVREEAVYIVDRLCGSQASVPVTTRASVDVGGVLQEGSVQVFHRDVLGYIEDYGMPLSVERARAFVPQEHAEALALLDMRVFNMDRHPGNLLLLGVQPYGLGPIDHGCCLPPWWELSEAVFDAWDAWPHLACEPSEKAVEIAGKAYEKLQDVCDHLKAVPLEPEAVVTLRLCTLFVYVGVHELRLPLASLASLMVRGYEHISELTWLEKKVMSSAARAGAEVQVTEGLGGCEELEVLDASGFQVEEFLKDLEGVFRAELRAAAHAAR